MNWKTERDPLLVAIDMDEWKYSWHLDERTPEGRERCKQIIQEKIASRVNQIHFLREQLSLLQASDTNAG